MNVYFLNKINLCLKITIHGHHIMLAPSFVKRNKGWSHSRCNKDAWETLEPFLCGPFRRVGWTSDTALLGLTKTVCFYFSVICFSNNLSSSFQIFFLNISRFWLEIKYWTRRIHVMNSCNHFTLCYV